MLKQLGLKFLVLHILVFQDRPKGGCKFFLFSNRPQAYTGRINFLNIEVQPAFRSAQHPKAGQNTQHI